MEFAGRNNQFQPVMRPEPNSWWFRPFMKKKTATTLRAFLIELAVYSVLVVIYFFLVLHFLGAWLYPLASQHRYGYAAMSILLICGQAVLLEGVTTFLLRLIVGRSE